MKMIKKIKALFTLLSVSLLMASCGSSDSQTDSADKQNASSPDPIEIVRTGSGRDGWGFETTRGVKLFNGRTFKMASEFAHGYSTVAIEKNGKRLYGVINHKGEEVIPITSEDVIGLPGKGGYFAVKKNGKYGLMNVDQKMTIPPVYKFMTSRGIDHNQVFAQDENGMWGSLNVKTGKPIIEFKYERPGTNWSCERTRLEVEKGKFVYFDPNGNPIHDGYFSRALWFVEPFNIAMAKKDGKYGFINKNGEVVINFEYSDYKMVEEYKSDDIRFEFGVNKRYILEEGYIILEKDGKWGYLNTKGEVVVPFEFDNISIVAKGKTLIAVTKGDKRGSFDIKTQELKWTE